MEHIWATVLGLTGLLAVAVLILPAAGRLNMPYTVLLAVFGCVLGFVGLNVEPRQLGIVGDFLEALRGFEITSEAVLFIFLPALVFEAALAINVRRLLDDIAPILALAVIGLLISTAIVGTTMSLISGVGLIACLLLGAIVSATDPVAVVAIFRDLGVPKRLAILVEGESLFNDATAIVVFTILGTMLLGQSDPGLLAGTASFVKVFAGGGVVGYLLARGLCEILKRLREVPLVEITLTISLAYLSFIVAEHYLHVSGVVAVVVAALVLGSYGRTVISPRIWHGLLETWEQIGFWANTLIFVLVGLAVPSILKGVGLREASWIAALVIAALIARAVIIYGLIPLLNRVGMEQRVSTAYKTVMFWGGLRGAVSLALALAVMENAAYGPETQRFIGVLVTGFVLFTLFVNAPSMLALLRLLGLDKLSPAELAIRNRAMALSLANIGESIEATATAQEVAPGLADDIAGHYRGRLNEAQSTMDALKGIAEDDWVAIGLATLGNQERNACLKQFADGFIASDVARQLLGQVDDILDGVKARGVDGYKSAVDRRLGFDVGFRLALQAQRRLGWSRPLARRLADRFEVLLATWTILREVRERGLPKVVSMVGEGTGRRLGTLLAGRLNATEQALSALRLQYPDYANLLQQRYLGRLALRLEQAEYDALLESEVISSEVFADLERELEARERQYERRPKLDLGLEPEKLVAKVPFLAVLRSDRIADIARLLKPRLAIPGETIVSKGETGREMYFISTGCVEVALEPEPRQLGSGDFFGEIALLREVPRTADVTAQGFCDLLTLSARDFHALLD
ncbi:MAG: cation:proton antiporter, partial [Kiloniellales bacterium]